VTERVPGDRVIGRLVPDIGVTAVGSALLVGIIAILPQSLTGFPGHLRQDVPRPAAGRLRPAAPAAGECGFGVRTRRSKAEEKSSGKLTTCCRFPTAPSHCLPRKRGTVRAGGLT
jgi:hypothetical protein